MEKSKYSEIAPQEIKEEIMDEEHTSSYHRFRNIAKTLYEHRIFLTIVFLFFVMFQLGFLLARLRLTWTSWAITLIPTYVALGVIIALYFYILQKSKVTPQFAWHTVGLALIYVGFVLFAVLLSIRLDRPDLLDDSEFLLPPLLYFAPLILGYVIGYMLCAERYSRRREKSHDLS
jgi:hypothetical protein